MKLGRRAIRPFGSSKFRSPRKKFQSRSVEWRALHCTACQVVRPNVWLDADGKAFFGFNNLRIKLNYTDKGVSSTAIDIGGSIDNTWTTEAQNLHMCYQGSDAALQIVIPKSFE